MKFSKINWSVVWAHSVWAIFWIGFYIVWGRILWTTAEFGSPEWMLDNYGHGLFGFAISLMGIYEIRLMFPKYYLCKRSNVLYVIVPFLIALPFAVVWELGEMLRDSNSTETLAQKGGPDTTLDIIITFVLSWISIGCYRVYDRCTSNQDEVKEQELIARAETLREEKKNLNRELRALRRNDIRGLPRRVFDRVTDILTDDRES